MSTKRIAVLMGGVSAEREVSLKSGNAVADALAARGHDVLRLDLGLDADRQLRLAKSSFGMEVAYNNRRRLPEAEEAALGVRFEPELETLIRSSDYLSLNCPSTPETRGMLNAERIATMKPGSFVINSGRGDLIDEPALIAALESGHLGGAGLDVFVGEPNIRPEFIRLKNVTALPHLGSATIEGRTAAGEKIVRNIQAWIAGETPPDLV